MGECSNGNPVAYGRLSLSVVYLRKLPAAHVEYNDDNELASIWKKVSWSSWMYFPSIYMEGSRKTTKKF